MTVRVRLPPKAQIYVMGFHKRFLNEKLVLSYLKNNNVKSLFHNVEALIFEDEFASRVHELYEENLTDTEILNIIYNENNQSNQAN